MNRLPVICTLVLFLSTLITAQDTGSWSVGLNALLAKCSPTSAGQKHQFLDSIRVCLQRRALIAMDALLSDDVIPVLNGIELVRFKGGANSTSSANT